MKKTCRVLISLTSIVLVTGVIIYRIRRRNTSDRLAQVANEGYETAHEILFPGVSKRGRRLHFGPILPS